MTTTDYKIIKGSVSVEPTNVEHVQCVRMTAIPADSIGFAASADGHGISFKWNDTTGFGAMREKILDALNEVEAVEQSEEELEIITGLEAI